MRLSPDDIAAANKPLLERHSCDFSSLAARLSRDGIDPDSLLRRLGRLEIAVPSWALAAGGTRFGRFGVPGEPRTIEEKLLDVALLSDLTRHTRSVSLHIPWDTPRDPRALSRLASELGLSFDAVNSNTFQDQDRQKHSYKFGSLSHTDRAVRSQAVDHNLEVISIGRRLGSRSLTLWLADGSNFPGQSDFTRAYERTRESLKRIYAALPADWRLLIEYKPFEPAFYSTVVSDWGTALLLATSLGRRALVLIDLGHHLIGTNIEQIVARLIMRRRLGGFHFNDSRYADDDLSAGSVKPFQLFLIFVELLGDLDSEACPALMIDTSNNTKDPLEDLIQSLEAIALAHAHALLLDRDALRQAQEANDAVRVQELLADAFRTDVRPLVAEVRRRMGAAVSPLDAFRRLKVRARLTAERRRR
ncbi:MAG: TIM barrel protein [Planctomycetota bacterium]